MERAPATEVHAEMKRRGDLYVVSGPSGSGKTSLCKAWLARCPDLRLSVSATTRPPRPGEVHGRDYYFLCEEEFSAARQRGDFLECAFVHGHWYGTRAADVDALRSQGFDVVLEIDWQGARQVAEKCPEACRIFILPPSLRELEERLRKRGQDDEAVIRARLAAAESEMAHASEADYRIVNRLFGQALQELLRIYRQRRGQQVAGM